MRFFKMFKDFEATKKEMAVVDEIARIVTSTLDIDQVYEQFAAEVKKLVDFDRAAINIIDHDSSSLVSKYLWGQRYVREPVPLEGSQIQQVVSSGQSLIHEDARPETGIATEVAAAAAGFRSSIRVPLATKGKVVGTYTLRSRRPRAYGEREQAILERLASQIAPAIENARLYEEAQRTEEEQRRLAREEASLAEIGRIIGSSLRFEDVYEPLFRQVAQLIPLDGMGLARIDLPSSTFNVAYTAGIYNPSRSPGATYPLKENMSGKVVSTGSTYVFHPKDRSEVERLHPEMLSGYGVGLRSHICVPLKARDETMGALHFRALQANAYNDGHTALAERIGFLIGPALENARLYEEAQRTEEEQRRVAQEEASLAEIGRIISSSLRFEDVYEPLFRQVAQLIPVDLMGLARIDMANGTFTVAYREGLGLAGRALGQTYPMKGSSNLDVVATGSTWVFHPKDRFEIERMHPNALAGYDEGIRSYLCVPLKARDEITGALQFRTAQPNAYDDHHVILAERIGFLVGAALDNARLYEETRNAEEAERRRSEELRALLATASILATPISFDDKVSGVMEELARIADADLCVFRVAESDGLRLIGFAGSPPPGFDLLPYGQNVPATVIEQRRTLVIDDYPNHPLVSPNFLARGVKSTLCAPVMSKGSVLGEISVSSLRHGHFTTERVDLLMAIINSLGTLLENARLEEEQKRAEEHVREAGRLASIGELAAGVAHEINNPLTSVLGYSEMLLSKPLPDAMRSGIETVYAEAQRAAKVVQNLLFFARRSGPKKRLLVLNSVIERALEMKSHDFRRNNINVITELSSALPQTTVDEHQMIQVILNILANAEQAMQDRNNGQITVRSTNSEGKIEISITDDGPGISPSHLKRIFEPFFTTKEVGQGTGLGLSVSYGTVKQHGGDIWADSTEGQGTTFHITLPIVDHHQMELSPIASSTPKGKTTRHLLIVDDEPSIRDLLREYLELERYTVDLAADGNEAWRKLRTMEYDCILLDLQMPGMNGGELYRLIQEADSSMAGKVVFITGDGGNWDTSEFITTVTNPVLLKPFHLDDLHRQVSEVIEATEKR